MSTVPAVLIAPAITIADQPSIRPAAVGQVSRTSSASRLILLLCASALSAFALSTVRSAFAQSFSYQSQFGTPGAGTAQFNGPVGVAIDPTTRFLVVADSNNNRVQIFNSAGVYQSQFGTQGAGAGMFSGPDYVAIDPLSHRILVTDSNNHRVQVFNSAGTFQGEFGSLGSGNAQFNHPSGIAIDPTSRNVVVADQGNHRVQIFSSSFVYSSQFGASGAGNGQFGNYPQGVAIDPGSHDIFVADPGNSRVQVFSSSGAYHGQFGTVGSGDGQFSANSPAGIAVDPIRQNVIVADPYNNRVQVFSVARSYVGQFGGFGSGNGQLNSPQGVSVDSNTSAIVVSDWGNNRVQIFAQQGVTAAERAALISIYTQTSGGGWADNLNWCSGGCSVQGTPVFNVVGTECTWYGVYCNATVSHVTKVDLHGNHLTGVLAAPSGLPALVYLDLSINQLQGTSPDIAVTPLLSHFDVSYNRLSGALPTPPAQTAANEGSARVCPNPLILDSNVGWNWLAGQTPWWGPADGGCDRVFGQAFEPPTFVEWIEQIGPLVESAQSFLGQQIALNSPTAIQDTVAYITSHSVFGAAIAQDGASILISSQNGQFTFAIITDGPDRPWNASGGMAAGVRPVALPPLAPDFAASTPLKNNKVLLLFPQREFDLFGAQSDNIANLPRLLRDTGHVVDVVTGPVPVDVLLGLDSYGTVVDFTHGGIWPSTADKINRTNIDSGQAATAVNINADVAALKADPRTSGKDPLTLITFGSTHQAPFGDIFYTTAFFDSLDLSGTLLITGACHSQDAVAGGDSLAAAVQRHGGTLIGWQNSVFVYLDEKALGDVVGCFGHGASIAQCLTNAQSAWSSSFWSLSYLPGFSSISDLALSGDGTLTMPSHVGPSGYCINEWDWIYPPGNWDTSRIYGSSTPVTGSNPQCDVYPYTGCVTNFSYACSGSVPNGCGVVCSP